MFLLQNLKVTLTDTWKLCKIGEKVKKLDNFCEKRENVSLTKFISGSNPGCDMNRGHDHQHHHEVGAREEDDGLATDCYFNLSDCSASTDGGKSNFNTKDFAFR